MLLHQFPDINMVRKLRNDAESQADKWRNCILNIKCGEVSRTGVESPYSLFMNVAGHSYCRVNNTQHLIETETYLLAQPGEQYDLLIDSATPVEIFNIHINRDFFNDVASTLVTSDEMQLEGCVSFNAAPKLFSQLHHKDAKLKTLLGALNTCNDIGTDRFDLVLAKVVSHLLLANEEIKTKINRLPPVTAAVKTELYKRLASAADYILSNYTNELNLNTLCRIAAMSKFHFLRLFKVVYGISPYQYLTRVRMERAVLLLKTTRDSVSGIAGDLGYEYPGSFIKTFHKSYGMAPLQYRKSG